jgi:hypothetical protein
MGTRIIPPPTPKKPEMMPTKIPTKIKPTIIALLPENKEAL